MFPSHSNNKGQNSEVMKEREEEVEQQKIPTNVLPLKQITTKGQIEGTMTEINAGHNVHQDLEGVAESLGAVSISSLSKQEAEGNKAKEGKTKKWVRQKTSKARKNQSDKKVINELGKRSLVEVMVTEGNMEAGWGMDKRTKGDATMVDHIESSGTVVLDAQHHQRP